MLQWRHLVNDEAQSNDSGTYRLELPVQGNLHALHLKLKCTNGATDAHLVSMFDVVDNIEIIGAGQEVIYSLIPEVAEKLYETLTGNPIPLDQDESASAVQEIMIPIWFGRRMFDPDYYLPLERVARSVLEIDYSPNIAAAAGFATGTFTVDVVGLMSEPGDVSPYRGTFVTRELRNFTSAASGDIRTEITSNRDHRFLGVYAYEADVADGTDISRVRLQEQSGSRTPLDLDWDDFLLMNRELFGAEINHYAKLLAQNNDVWQSRIGEVLWYEAHALTAVDTTGDVLITAIVDALTGDQLTLDVGSVDITAGAETITAYATDSAILVMARGYSPSYFGLIPFFIDGDDGGYYNPANKGKVEVVLTQGGADADCRIVAQEVASF